MTRQVILKVGTTGLNVANNRIFELAAIEIIDGKKGDTYHQYINPEQEFEEGATLCTKMKQNDLASYPTFDGIANDFQTFIEGAELIVQTKSPHFDLYFVNKELRYADKAPICLDNIKTVVSLFKEKQVSLRLRLK